MPAYCCLISNTGFLIPVFLLQNTQEVTMFGYVVVNEPDLKIREFDLYRSYYCGICMDLKEHYGQRGRLTLSYDTVFLALLLTSLYEPKDQERMLRCAIHPVQKHRTRQNEYTRYAADIGIILSYYSCLDDWNDERDPKKKVMAAALRKKCEAASAVHPDKAALIEQKLNELRELENSSKAPGSTLSPAVLLDRAGGIFGDLMAEVFDYKQDIWSPALRRTGFFLGKFIYILDAYDDMKKDEKSGSYNPLLMQRDMPDLPGFVKGILTMTISECTAAFETLPIVENIDILRNILYCGIWCKFDDKNGKQNGAKEPEVSQERAAQDE